MDQIIEKLELEYDLDNQEILIVLGVLGIVAYSNNEIGDVEDAYSIINEKLKIIAKEILAMA